jgi:hypothetical protein
MLVELYIYMLLTKKGKHILNHSFKLANEFLFLWLGYIIMHEFNLQ